MSSAFVDVELPSDRDRSGVAVVLAQVRPTQWHAGLRYESDGATRLVHLAWYFDLQFGDRTGFVDASFRDQLAAINLDLLPFQVESVVAMCDAIERWPQPTRYGTSIEKLDINTNGSIPAQSEFTCATFVLALLKAGGVTLVDLATWSAPTEEDRAWQEKIADALATHLRELLPTLRGELAKVAAQDLEAFERREGVGSPRVRPLQLGGAALCESEQRPVGYELAERRASEVPAALVRPRDSTPSAEPP